MAEAVRFDLDDWLATRRREVDELLDRRIAARPREDDPGRLIEAVRYSLLAPGKRLRPILALGAAEAVGGSLDEPVRVACATLELVHCYSLVHDDLPAMDDDDERRGRPTSHKVFGEATAILAGDALLTLAFEWLAEAGSTSDRAPACLRASRALARAAGIAGMVRGQARDLGEPAPGNLEALELLHREKTAALFRAALEVGAEVGGGRADEVADLARFGECYGVAFQHADDLDDEDHVGHAERARTRISELCRQADDALTSFGNHARALRAIAAVLARRAAA